jgi:2-C-methyl-D-erythritol 2,4-cyclodiphosphate synthase
MKLRIGQGYDVHRLTEGRLLILGGVTIPHDKGLLGHSDADVLAHAVMDALLGAAALGDIGTHFPDTDPDFKNADSLKLLKHVVSLLEQHHFSVVNIDVTLILQKPKVAPFLFQMRHNLAQVMNIPVDSVSVKATTEEGLGFTGREEGIAAMAAVLVTGSR